MLARGRVELARADENPPPPVGRDREIPARIVHRVRRGQVHDRQPPGQRRIGRRGTRQVEKIHQKRRRRDAAVREVEDRRQPPQLRHARGPGGDLDRPRLLERDGHGAPGFLQPLQAAQRRSEVAPQQQQHGPSRGQRAAGVRVERAVGTRRVGVVVDRRMGDAGRFRVARAAGKMLFGIAPAGVEDREVEHERGKNLRHGPGGGGGGCASRTIPPSPAGRATRRWPSGWRRCPSREAADGRGGRGRRGRRQPVGDRGGQTRRGEVGGLRGHARRGRGRGQGGRRRGGLEFANRGIQRETAGFRVHLGGELGHFRVVRGQRAILAGAGDGGAGLEGQRGEQAEEEGFHGLAFPAHLAR